MTETLQTFGDAQRDEIRYAVRALYDFQRLRIQAGGRQLQKDAGKKVDLAPGELGYMDTLTDKLASLEAGVERHVEVLCAPHPMNAWLRGIRGIGPRMAGVILSELDATKYETVSKMWRASGLAVVPGENPEDPWHAERRVKGEKLHYNSFLKSKLIKVLADSFIKSGSPYKRYYDDYKHRKEAAGWGRNKAHRDIAARRYMVKELLKAYWLAARQQAGLPIRQSYAEAYLGRSHGDHKGSSSSMQDTE